MEITDLKQMTKEEVFNFIRQRLSFSKELQEQFRHVNKDDLAKEHRRFEMSGNESKTGQCTIFNTAILNEFADLGIYDYTSYLFLDFHNGTPTVYLKYFSENENLEYSFTGYTTTEMPNYHSILEQYGVSIEKGVVLEGDNNHYVSGNPLYLVPEIQSCDATGSLSGSNSYVLMPIGQSIKTLDSKSDDITVTDMLTSTSSAYLKADPENMESLSKEENDESGPFTLAAAITEAIGSGSDSEEETETETIVEGESSASQVEAESETEAAEDAKETRLVVLASSQFLTSNTDFAVSGGNTKLLTNALSWICGQSSSISIPSKSMQLSYLTLTSANVNLWSIITIAVLPVLFLVIGGVIWLKRRKK